MNITRLKSASVIVEDEGVKILFDPWLVDGEYYGSWAHYPPCDFKPEDFNDVDFIYISHIHPDHFSTKTLCRMNENIPILIHNFHFKYFKSNIESLGFKVIELENNKRIHLKNNLHINIIAADNCNPELCFKYFGCSLIEKSFGSTSIDTMCVVDNGKQVLVNTNDCPYPLAKTSASIFKDHYKKIDMLLVGYSSASAYPQCFDLSIEEKQKAKNDIVNTYWSYVTSYVNLFEPRFFMPFAGRYTLAGKNSLLNDQKAVGELEDVYNYFDTSTNVNKSLHKCIILNSMSTFDITTGKSSEPYKPINLEMKNKYIQNVLSKVKFDYENEVQPKSEELLKLFPKCYERFESIRKKLNFSSDTTVLIEISSDRFLALYFNGEGYKIITKDEAKKFEKYIMISLDKRLLKWILQGPKFAHWNNAEIGSHLRFKRFPNIYERGLFYCLSFFHI